jgi:hypothetical protein
MPNTESKDNSYNQKLKQLSNIIYRNTLITDKIIKLDIVTTKPAKEVILIIHYKSNLKDRLVRVKRIKLN